MSTVLNLIKAFEGSSVPDGSDGVKRKVLWGRCMFAV